MSNTPYQVNQKLWHAARNIKVRIQGVSLYSVVDDKGNIYTVAPSVLEEVKKPISSYDEFKETLYGNDLFEAYMEIRKRGLA